MVKRVRKKVSRKVDGDFDFESRVGKAWFRRVRFGWLPISWEGWVFELVLMVVVLGSVFYFDLGVADSVLRFLLVVVLCLLVYFIVAKKKRLRK